jgi:predicted CoA-binding protein
MPSERVKQFYESESFATIGVSDSRRNFAWSIFDQLASLGKRVYVVNPDNGRHEGVRFYDSFDTLPETPEAIIVSLDLSKVSGVLEAVKNSGAKHVWFQQGSYDDEILDTCDRLGIDPIKGCSLMHMPEAGFPHNLHRWINELFTKGYR